MNQLRIKSSRKLYKRLLARLILVIIYGALLIFVLPKVAQLLSPFIVAFIGALIINPIASAINKLVNRINKNIMLPRKFTAFILNLLVLLLACLTFYYLSYTIIKEVISL